MVSYDKTGLKRKFAEIGGRIFELSRNELYLSMRFFDLALGKLEFTLDLSTLTLGTDGVSCFYNPNYLMNLYEENRILVNRAYVHMLLHCIFRHMYQDSPYGEEYHDLACDIAVESVIDAMDYKAVFLTVRDEREEIYRELRSELPVLTAEGIAGWLVRRRLSCEEFGRLAAEFRRDDHDFFRRRRKEEKGKGGEKQGAAADPQAKRGEEDGQEPKEGSQDGPNRDGENRLESDEKNREQWEKISRKLAVNLDSFEKSAGSRTGDLLKALKSVNREICDFRSFLKQFSVVKEENHLDPDSFDYNYYTYGLSLYKNMPLIEPLEQRETEKIEEFAIVVDTSGSCSGRLVHEFLKQTWAILKDEDSFFRKRRVHLIQCDAEVRSDTVITDEAQIGGFMESLEVSGFGGTDFRPAFSYINGLIESGEMRNLKGLLYFTDGCGTYPLRRPAYDTAFVFIDGDYEDRDVPGWAMKAVLYPDKMRKN